MLASLGFHISSAFALFVVDFFVYSIDDLVGYVDFVWRGAPFVVFQSLNPPANRYYRGSRTALSQFSPIVVSPSP